MHPIDDSGSIIKPKVCGIYQLGIYRDSKNELFVDGDIFSKLDETSKAAFYVHEALYWYLRKEGEITSARVRLAVAQAFAGHDFVPYDRPISEPVEAFDCETAAKNLLWYAALWFYCL